MLIFTLNSMRKGSFTFLHIGIQKWHELDNDILSTPWKIMTIDGIVQWRKENSQTKSRYLMTSTKLKTDASKFRVHKMPWKLENKHCNMKSCLDFVKNLVVGLTLSLNKRPRDLSVHKRNPRPMLAIHLIIFLREFVETNYLQVIWGLYHIVTAFFSVHRFPTEKVVLRCSSK